MSDLDESVDGARLLDSTVDVIEAIQKGDWAGGLLAVAGAASEAVELAEDPLAAVVASGLGWLIEHVPPLRQIFDDLTADPAAIKALADTWNRVADGARQGAEELDRIVRADTTNWHGPAVEAYRPFALLLTEGVRNTADVARTVADAIVLAGDVVLGVRAVVRDMIAKLAADATTSFFRASPLISTGPGGVIAVGAFLIERAWSWASRAMEWVHRVAEAMQRLRALLERLAPALSAMPDIRVPTLPAAPPPSTFWRPPKEVVLDAPDWGRTAYSLNVETGKQLNEPGVG